MKSKTLESGTELLPCTQFSCNTEYEMCMSFQMDYLDYSSFFDTACLWKRKLLRSERKEMGGKYLSASEVSLCFYLCPAVGDNLQMRHNHYRPFQD